MAFKKKKDFDGALEPHNSKPIIFIMPITINFLIIFFFKKVNHTCNHEALLESDNYRKKTGWAILELNLRS